MSLAEMVTLPVVDREGGRQISGEERLAAAVILQAVKDVLASSPATPLHREADAFLSDPSRLERWVSRLDIDAEAFAEAYRRNGTRTIRAYLSRPPVRDRQGRGRQGKNLRRMLA